MARKGFVTGLAAASSSPVLSSERPYIGELSITVPPAAKSASSTPGRRWYSSVSGRRSKPIQVPQPTTGRASFVEGMGRVVICIAGLRGGCWAKEGSAAPAHRAAPSRSNRARVRA
ncbi:hypothetical protein D3C85_1504130 [compost metagenome]